MSKNTVVIVESLSPKEKRELDAHEATIEAGLKTFWAVGTALSQIRDRNLYRGAYPTFEEYCQWRWGFSASRARQLIAGAETQTRLQEVAPELKLPSERHARQLRQFEEELQPAIAKIAISVAATQGREVSSGDIKRVGEVLQEAAITGTVDSGDGNSTPFTAALTVAQYEDLQRQREHIRESLDRKAEKEQSTQSVTTVTVEAKWVSVRLNIYDPRQSLEALKSALGARGVDELFNLYIYDQAHEGVMN